MLKGMKTHTHLKPGQQGTRRLVKQYSDDLICVRYRYDEASRTRIKTVELILDKKDLPKHQQRFADDAQVPVRIAYGELDLGEMAKTACGRWDSDVKLWYIPYGKITGTGLENHIILDASLKSKVK